MTGWILLPQKYTFRNSYLAFEANKFVNYSFLLYTPLINIQQMLIWVILQ